MAATRKNLAIMLIGEYDEKMKFLNAVTGNQARDFNTVNIDAETDVTVSTAPQFDKLADSFFKIVDKVIVIVPFKKIPSFNEKYNEKVEFFYAGADDAMAFTKKLVDKAYPQVENQKPVETKSSISVQQQEPVENKETKEEKKKDKGPSFLDKFSKFVSNPGGSSNNNPPKPPKGGFTIN